MVEATETSEVIGRKVTAERDEPLVVFHIGMRINAIWKLHRWLPILLLGPRMVRELATDENSGLLGSRTVLGPGIRNVGFVQYWESFEALRDYARDDTRLHFPAWQDFYEHGTKEDAAIGIWHETYVVDPEDIEAVYNNMPAHGLGAAQETDIVPADGDRRSAAGRLGRSETDEYPVESGQSI